MRAINASKPWILCTKERLQPSFAPTERNICVRSIREIARIAVSNGIFAVLFCSLLIYELKITGRRENKYQSVIEGLTRSLSALKQVQSDVKDVESVLRDVASHVGIKEENHESIKNIEVAVGKEKA